VIFVWIVWFHEIGRRKVHPRERNVEFRVNMGTEVNRNEDVLRETMEREKIDEGGERFDSGSWLIEICFQKLLQIE
jgi:hypothetical protein